MCIFFLIQQLFTDISFEKLWYTFIRCLVVDMTLVFLSSVNENEKVLIPITYKIKHVVIGNMQCL